MENTQKMLSDVNMNLKHFLKKYYIFILKNGVWDCLMVRIRCLFWVFISFIYKLSDQFLLFNVHIVR